MKTSQTGLNLIEEFEGCILGAYDDATDRVVPAGGSSRGTLTIGYGHTSDAGPPKVYVGQRITKQQANEILASDLAKVEQQVSSRVKVPLNQNQFDALVSFTFNVGPGALSRSGVLKNVNAQKWQAAADAFMQWTRGNGQVLQGLVRRRKAERALFLTPYKAPAVTKPTSPVVVGTGAVVAGGAAIGAQIAPHHINWLMDISIIGLVCIAVGLGIYLYERYSK